MRNLSNQKKLKQIAVDWFVERHEFNVLGTITFKQATRHSNGNREQYTREQFEETCGEVGRRVKKNLKSKYGKLVNDIYWVTSIENGHGDKRIHAHMMFDVSIKIDLLDFESAFRDICSRMDKIYDKIDLQELINHVGESKIAAMTYILKEGTDAISLSYSSIRS